MESMPQSHTLRVVRGPAEAASAEAAATPAELFRTTETRSELEGVNVRRGAGVDETEESLRFSEGMILERATDGLDGRPRALLRNTNGDHVEPEQGGVMWARLRGVRKTRPLPLFLFSMFPMHQLVRQTPRTLRHD